MIAWLLFGARRVNLATKWDRDLGPKRGVVPRFSLVRFLVLNELPQTKNLVSQPAQVSYLGAAGQRRGVASLRHLAAFQTRQSRCVSVVDLDHKVQPGQFI